MNKILIIGCGSIGQRHIQALLKLGEMNIAAYRTGKGQVKKLPEEIDSNIHVFTNIETALNWNPTHLIISNPTSLHLKYIRIGIKNGLKIFVEKPITNSLKEFNKNTITIDEIKNYKGIVGYNLRFNKLFKKIKELIETKKYGNALSSYLEVGHYLPFWHPYEDYRKSYAAKKELGGGVLKTLSHEIDLVFYLFKDINNIFAKINKLSKLEIDVDDNVDILLSSDLCKSIRIHLDYLKPLPTRKGEVQFEEGLLEYNFNESTIYFTDYKTKKKELIFSEKTDYNDQYIDQMKYFLSKNNNSNIACTFGEGIKSLKAINVCEISNIKGVEYEFK